MHLSPLLPITRRHRCRRAAPCAWSRPCAPCQPLLQRPGQAPSQPEPVQATYAREQDVQHAGPPSSRLRRTASTTEMQSNRHTVQPAPVAAIGVDERRNHAHFFGPRASISKPMPGAPDLGDALLATRTTLSVNTTGAAGLNNCTQGLSNMMADGLRSKSPHARRSMDCCRFSGSACTCAETDRPQHCLGGNRLWRSPISVTPVPGCGWLPVMAVVALSNTHSVKS